ncbi:MAG: methylamine utilization protein [Dokdonella sp.]
MNPYFVLAAATLMSPGIVAHATELVVLVVGQRFSPVADAVIEVRGDADVTQSFAPVTRIIDQRGETFIPYVEIFRPGDRVEFHNSDRTRHHVYSFAQAKSFEFVIAPGNSAPEVTLDHSGEIAVGCNIHDHMIAHLYVSDAAYVAKTGSDGRVVFASLPKGHVTVRVWHPQLRPGRAQPEQRLTLQDEAANLTFLMQLLPDPRAGAGDRERSEY